jgi:hypothetical protein
MVFSPPDAADVWQHNKALENSALRPISSKLPKRKPTRADKGKSVDRGEPAEKGEVEDMGGAQSKDDTEHEEHERELGEDGQELEQLPSASRTKSKKEKKKKKKAKMGNANSAARRRNVWEGRTQDGQDRSHIPPMSMAMFGIRIAQLVLAVIFLVLASFAAFTLNMGNVSARLW